MDLLVDTMRVRGSSATRLARIAASALPPVLERALAGLPDGRLDTVMVAIDVHPADVDDATLAVIWADAIRAQLALELVGLAATEPDAVAASRETRHTRAVSLAQAAIAARSWMSAGDSAAPVPTNALQLGVILERATASGMEVAEEHARLLVALEQLVRPCAAVPSQQTGRAQGVATIAPSPPKPQQAHAPPPTGAAATTEAAGR